MQANSLLLIEDNPGDARLLREMFAEDQSHHMQLTQVGSMREAEKLLAKASVDVILLDLGLPDTEGVGAVQRVHAAAPRIPLVVLTGLDDESMAVLALKEGAQDYLVKGHIETRGLLRALRYAIERKAMEDALYMEKERAQVTLDSIGDAVICTDVAGEVTFLNVMAEEMTGWSRQDAEGQMVCDVFRTAEASSRETISTPLRSGGGTERGSHGRSNCILVRRDGVECPIEDSVAPIHDREGRSTGSVVVFRDVTLARNTSLRMAHLAQHDFLTGLPNRVLLSDRINQAIVLARRNGKQIAVLFLDLDGFKHINDSLGHSVGDRLLQSVSRALVECARASDTVSRQGGDEFIVLLSEMALPEDAAVAARRMLKVIAEPHSIDKLELHVTTSIGVSIYPDDGLDAETLIKNADTAMYQAKENGCQKYQFYEPAMNARAVERQSIEQSLRRALERNEFEVHYQPKIDIRTGTIIGAEALLRWTHPIRGAVSPAQFIPVAEDCGLILPIGQWVLHAACLQAQAWVAAGLPVTTMAVNVSAKEFRDDKFLERVFAVLAETGLDPTALELELTESALMKNSASAASILRSLRDKGVQVAVDDFGTGHSSLSYLRKFPVDALKIDQSFVGRIASGGEDASIVMAVIGMARNLKLRVVAEGVETAEQLAFLQTHECDEAQGYYFGRPVRPEQFATVLGSGISRPVEGRTFGSPRPVPSRKRRSDRMHARSERASWRKGIRKSVAGLEKVVESPGVPPHESTVKSETPAEVVRVKDELSAMVIHDLRNPLTVILTNTNFLLEEVDGPPECRQAIEDCQSAGQRMLRLLANVGDIRQHEAESLLLNLSKSSLPGLLQPIVEQRRVLASGRSVSITLLPSPEITVTADADLLKRTVENILDYAVRYAPRGGCIEVELRESGREVEIRIGKSGVAIPEDQRVALFEKHGQAGSEVGRENLGWGMYFCRVAVEAQGGQIRIEETERLPTVFCIRVPR